jgi:hypothetical protein
MPKASHATAGRIVVAVLVAAVALLVLVSLRPIPSSSAAVAAPAGSVVPPCAWPVVTDPEQANVAYPDTAATYWTTPYRVEPGTRLVVNGSYPDARFFSFNAYDSTFGDFTVDGVPGALYDYQIDPKAGSVNPWQHRGGARAGAAGRFRVTLQSSVPADRRNVMPIAPAGTTAGTVGFLVMRVYLPAGDDFSAVQLPRITVVSGSGTTTITPCRSGQRTPIGTANANLPADATAALRQAAKRMRSAGRADSFGGEPCRGSACPPDLRFARASAATTDSVFPNSASAYVSALFRPDSKRVVLVRAHAPRTPALVPPGTEPLPWPTPKYQLQYFSLCNNIYRKPWPVIINQLPGNQTDPGCRADNQTALDAHGRFTYVVAAQAQAAAVSRWPGVTFVPTSVKDSRFREVLILRNMLSSSRFVHSALNAPENMSPQGAAQAMGRYYPRAVSCPLRFYLRHGPGGCLRRP